MTRYLKKCRIVGLAGLVSLAVFALPAAPAGAEVTCLPGNANPNYCPGITLSEQLISHGNFETVRINESAPPGSILHLTVTLRLGNHVFEPPLIDRTITVTSGKLIKLVDSFRKPTKPGTYDVRAVVATANGVTKTFDKKFTIKKHKKHKKHK